MFVGFWLFLLLVFCLVFCFTFLFVFLFSSLCFSCFFCPGFSFLLSVLCCFLGFLVSLPFSGSFVFHLCLYFFSCGFCYYFVWVLHLFCCLFCFWSSGFLGCCLLVFWFLSCLFVFSWGFAVWVCYLFCCLICFCSGLFCERLPFCLSFFVLFVCLFFLGVFAVILSVYVLCFVFWVLAFHGGPPFGLSYSVFLSCFFFLGVIAVVLFGAFVLLGLLFCYVFCLFLPFSSIGWVLGGYMEMPALFQPFPGHIGWVEILKWVCSSWVRGWSSSSCICFVYISMYVFVALTLLGIIMSISFLFCTPAVHPRAPPCLLLSLSSTIPRGWMDLHRSYPTLKDHEVSGNRRNCYISLRIFNYFKLLFSNASVLMRNQEWTSMG